MTVLATSTVTLKNFSYLIVFWYSFEYLGFHPETMTILGILMILDVLTGITRVWLNEGGRQIKSAVLKRGVTAKILLLAGLLATALSSRAMGLEFQNFAQAALTVIILGELYSILGNVHSARTGTPKVEFDAVAWMLARVRDLITAIVK